MMPVAGLPYLPPPFSRPSSDATPAATTISVEASSNPSARFSNPCSQKWPPRTVPVAKGAVRISSSVPPMATVASRLGGLRGAPLKNRLPEGTALFLRLPFCFSSPRSSSYSSCATRLASHRQFFRQFTRMEYFWSRGSIDTSEGLVEQLKQNGVIKSNKVAEAMQTIDRALFIPESTYAYVDNPMPIGYNATISAPHMHAICLELLKEHLLPGMWALDIGSGSGYLTACFAMMVGPQGRAVGVEHIPELVVSSISSIKKSAASTLLKDGALSIHVSDGRLGWPELGPYDAIHVGAAAPEIPPPLLEQLKPGGRMVIPVGNFLQDLKVVDKNHDGSISVHSKTSVRYVPLTSRSAQLEDC